MRGPRTGTVLVFVAVAFAGCVAKPPDPGSGPGTPSGDLPAIAPILVSGFHDESAVLAIRDAIVARAPTVAAPLAAGTSAGGREISGLSLTAPGDPSSRVRVLVDGGIHGDEVYGAEAAIYAAAWLVENYGRNATATRILETTDVRFVLLINPDGRAADTRENANGVDLNRNFDVDFGNPDPTCRSQTVSPLVPYYYAGPQPLSEPETRALAELMESFQPQIYLSHHTGRHALIRPWSACDPPHEMPATDDALLESIETWTKTHTTYQNTGTAEETAQRLFPPGAASGSSTDWCYLTYHCVALTLEVTELYGEGPTDPIRIAQEAFPITLHMLEHAQEYAAWRVPTS